MISIGMAFIASKFGISLLLNIILCMALKSASSKRIAWSFCTYTLPATFSNITDTPLIHRDSGYLLLIARLTSLHFISAIAGMKVCAL